MLYNCIRVVQRSCDKMILENFNEKNAPRTGSQQKYQEYTREIHFCTKSIPSRRRRILSSYFDEDTPSIYSISKNHHRQNCFFLSIYRALYQNKHIHVHLIHWRSHDICAIIRNSQVQHKPSIALVFYHKLKSRRVINIQLNSFSRKKRIWGEKMAASARILLLGTQPVSIFIAESILSQAYDIFSLAIHWTFSILLSFSSFFNSFLEFLFLKFFYRTPKKKTSKIQQQSKLK